MKLIDFIKILNKQPNTRKYNKARDTLGGFFTESAIVIKQHNMAQMAKRFTIWLCMSVKHCIKRNEVHWKLQLCGYYFQNLMKIT